MWKCASPTWPLQRFSLRAQIHTLLQSSSSIVQGCRNGGVRRASYLSQCVLTMARLLHFWDAAQPQQRYERIVLSSRHTLASNYTSAPQSTHTTITLRTNTASNERCTHVYCKPLWHWVNVCLSSHPLAANGKVKRRFCFWLAWRCIHIDWHSKSSSCLFSHPAITFCPSVCGRG